jgi:hypothetical protein
MNRKSDVDAILIAATQQYNSIRKDYERALQDKSLDLRVPVKNLMENLRSALDYMAHDIYESCCQSERTSNGQPDPKNVYFPYGKTEADFKAGVGSSLPGLAILAPDIYKILLSVQPFVCGDTWLCDLCVILNEKKHDRLKAQERSENETYTVESQYGSVTIPVNNPNIKVTSLPGAVKIFGVPAEFRKDGIHTASSDTLKHKRTIWIAFVFEGTNVNVINLLDKATVGIKNLAKELYQKI